jgi:hypothetical protein
MITNAENRFFKLTRAGIEDYKKSDPLKSARDLEHGRSEAFN